MDESDFKIILGFLIIIVVGGIGFPLGSLAEDALWLLGDNTVPLCLETTEESWIEQCKKLNKTYYSLKPIFQISGTVVGLIIGYKTSKTLGLFD